jgi:hypothetical protein
VKDTEERFAKSINPQGLQNYSTVKGDYLDALKHHASGKLPRWEKIDNASAGIFKFLSKNYASIIQAQDNPFKNALHAELGEYAPQDSPDRTYLAMDIVFPPVASPQQINEALKIYSDHRFRSHEDITPKKFEDVTQSNRAYLLKALPFTPWIQVDISDPESWKFVSGIDICPIIVNDDHGAAAGFGLDFNKSGNYLRLEKLLTKEGHRYATFNPIQYLYGSPYEPSPRIAHTNFDDFMDSIADVRKSCREAIQ